VPGFIVRGPLGGQGAACEAVLRALPDWFGIEESIAQYVRAVDGLPAFVALERALDGTDEPPGASRRADGAGERIVGLLALTRHSPEAAEIHVMGVLPERRRRGVGKALQAAAERWLRAEGVRFLTVKTLSATSDYAPYAQTRAFYAAMGFVPLMELPGLWGPENPCLVMVKALR
jgi:GNAT superfamily N-acetyltransferase